MNNLSFKGVLTVRSAPWGFTVTLDGQTNAHDLGHALAAAIAHYADAAVKEDPKVNRGELFQEAISGIVCGLTSNPIPLKKH